ncbi:hypothetical protein BDY24DRAFT_360264 [Mrakia frigida]|uniref:uncharacterized protein n=1 Tax=Mrakia frigida TaxID=29902 RepID=UPI003FCC1525
MVPNNSSSNTMTASPTTPRRRMTSVDLSTPASPIRTVYEPIGGDAIRLGDSNPLQAKDDHDGEEEGRDEMGDARMMNAGGLGGRNYTENAISRDGSVMTFHDRGTGSIRGVGGLQDLGAHQSSHHHNLNQTYPQAFLSSNLPDLSRTSASSPTAYPIGASAIQKDLDHSLRALLDQDVFLEMLRDPLGRHRFRIYLRSVGREALLDMWWDADVYQKLVKMVKTGALAMNDAYLTRGSPAEISGMPSQLSLEVMGNLQQTQIFSPFTKVQDHLLETLYQNDFQVFIRRKLIEHSQVRLGSLGQTDGIGEVFVITNPRLRDHPIVSVSEAFCTMTGYSAPAIVGRNCRFLQGPGTAPASVQRLRDALNEGEEITELLLNYTRTGVPFWNLLCMIPLRSASGSLVYFIGGQINVTGSISNTSRLSFLVGGEASSSLAEGSSKLNPLEFSPTVKKLSPHLARNPSVAAPEYEHLAAGSVAARKLGAGSVDDSELSSTGQELGGFGESLQSRTLTASRPPTSWNANGHTIGGGTGKRFGKLLSRLKSQRTRVSEKEDQLLMGAENDMSIEVGPLDSQIDYFSNTYNKVLVLRPKNQEIVFVTHHLLHYLGLPTLSSKAVFSSSLIHMDLVELIDCGEKDATKRVRAFIKLAIRKGSPLTVTCGVKILPGSKWSLTGGRGVSAGEVGLKRTQLRLTPCVDRDGSVSAYIALFS